MLADYATGRANRNLKSGERCAMGTPGGPGGGCPPVSGRVARCRRASTRWAETVVAA